MFLTIAKLFLSAGIGPITKQIELWQERRAEAERLENSMEVKRIDAELARLELIAAGHLKDRRSFWVQLLVSVPAFAVMWKLGLDIVMSNWPEHGLRTDPPSAWFQGYMGVVLSFWLLKAARR